VTGLRWEQVDLQRRTAWVAAEDAKGDQGLHISLNELAVEVLLRQRGKHPERVFTYNGRPIAWANTIGWRSALKRAGIHSFRWHDLRHTWASWLVQNGTPLYDLQEADGSRPKSCGATRISRRRTWRNMPPSLLPCCTTQTRRSGTAADSKKGLRTTVTP
jgi:integrase